MYKDIYKLTRRFISVFGDYSSDVVKELFIEISAYLNKLEETKHIVDHSDEVAALLHDVISESIFRITRKKVTFIISQGSRRGDQTTPRDIIKFIEARNSTNMKIKGLFIDYIDIMAPSDSKYTDYNDYNAHGIIVQELRNMASDYGIPVVTITQGTRDSENIAALSNANMADSHKKVRYSDYIYMVRLRYDLNLLMDEVKNDIVNKKEIKDKDPFNPNNQSMGFTSDFTELNKEDQLTVFEIKITKAKDGGKNQLKYHIFSGKNLRIYQSLEDYRKDAVEMKLKTEQLRNRIALIQAGLLVSTPELNEGSNHLLPGLEI